MALSTFCDIVYLLIAEMVLFIWCCEELTIEDEVCVMSKNCRLVSDRYHTNKSIQLGLFNEASFLYWVIVVICLDIAEKLDFCTVSLV